VLNCSVLFFLLAVIRYFTNSLLNHPDMSEPLIAIQTLIEFIRQSPGG